jgi:hypothetical protein
LWYAIDKLPADTSETCILQYIRQVAEWEEKIAASVIGEESPYTKLAQGSRLYHRRVSIDTYWRTLVGDYRDTSEGSTTRETHYDFRDKLRNARYVAMKYIGTDEYVALTPELLLLTTILTLTIEYSPE